MTIKENLSLVQGLQQRVSHSRLAEPAPTTKELSECYKAAFRSPDHAWLRPWRFIECLGDERILLGQKVAQAMKNEKPDLSEAQEAKFRDGPLRAPLVILCVADVTEHPKVPALEQQIAAGCAANNLISALYGFGYGAVWRTGESVFSKAVHKALNLNDRQVLLGYLYVGSKVADDKVIPELNQSDYVRGLTAQLADEG